MRDHEYWKTYYVENRERIYTVKAAWRRANADREKAFDRMRYLRKKTDISTGEIEQLWELSRKYPVRRHFFYPSP